MGEWQTTVNRAPSEGGIVVRNEEYWEDGAGAVLTLERDCLHAPVAITCGVYGSMVHTRYFASLADGEAAAEEMKPPLVELVQLVLGDDSRLDDRLKAFVDRFPT